MRWTLTWIATGLLAAGLVAYGYFAYIRPPELAVASVVEEPTELVLAAVGRLRANERISVFARAAGQVIELLKREGDQVAAGDVLGRLDDGQPRAVLAQRTAAAAAQRRQLAQTRRSYARAKLLLAGRFITRAGFEAARLVVERDEDELQRVDAATNEAASRLADFVILAPMAGRILVRPVDPGQIVDTRTQIFELVSQGPPDVETEIDESVAGALSVGMHARLAPAGMGGTVFKGSVSFIAPGVNSTTGGRTVRLSFDSPPKDAPPGLSVDVNITVETRDRALTLPRSAIANDSGAPYVMAVRSNKTVKQKVTFIDWPAPRVVVTSGVAKGDLVALDPLADAAGKNVTPVITPAAQ